MNRDTRVIAEIGENHVGDWERARKMVIEAAEAGADFAKFQTYSGEEVSEDDPEKEWFSRVELPESVHFEMREVCESNGIEFLTSVFSLDRARFLVEDFGVSKIKIASSELLNVTLLEYLSEHVDEVFISTGMASLEEVDRAVSHLENIEDVCVMQCTSQYPCPAEEANLAVIRSLDAHFDDHDVGYSDHTVGTLAPAIAVGLGATVVEKHFTLNKGLEGTDHVQSVNPGELQEMIGLIRQAEQLRGTAEKSPTPSERSIVDDWRSRFPKPGDEESSM